MYGRGISGKKEFPQDWDAIRIERAVAQTLRTPKWVRDPVNEFSPTVFGAEIDGVQIEVKTYLYQGRYAIERAYPVGGEGVIRNQEDGSIISVKKCMVREWRQDA